MFVAIGRVTKFTHVAFFDMTMKANAAQFLRQLLATFLQGGDPKWLHKLNAQPLEAA